MKQIVFLFALLPLPLTVSADAVETSGMKATITMPTAAEQQSSDDIIAFADAEVKLICVNKWDTNGDGELSKQEAAAVTDIGTVFRYNNYIKSFDEFQYFTGVTVINSEAFYSSNLVSVKMPNSVVKIEFRAFGNCYNLSEIVFPDNDGFSMSRSFEGCSALTTITLPKNLIEITGNAFCNCQNLKEINVDAANTILISVDGILFSKDGKFLISFPTGKEQPDYIIPEGTTTVRDLAFAYNKHLRSIVIPKSVTHIETYLFKGCTNLETIKVEDGNRYYDSRENCNAIISTYTNTLEEGCKNTVIPNTVTRIGQFAFSGRSSMTSISIPNSVKVIDTEAFDECSALTSVTLPNSLTSIGALSFQQCRSLTSISIPNSVKEILTAAFQSCDKLETFSIPNSVIDIGSSAFEYSLWWRNQPNGLLYKDNVLLGYKGNAPEGVLEIVDGPRLVTGFRSCRNLTSVVIPNSVKSIGYDAFEYCTGLTSVTIPSTVTYIGNCAFYGCI